MASPVGIGGPPVGQAVIIAGYHEVMASGGFLAISHASQDGQSDKADSHQDLCRRTVTPMTMRSRPQVVDLFAGFGIVEHPERFSGLAAVGRRE